MACVTILVETTRDLHDCLDDAGRPGGPHTRVLIQGLLRSCEALKQILREPEFKSFMRDDDPTLSWDAGVALLDDLQKTRERMESFLAAERELLTRAGLPSSVVDPLIERCRAIIVECRYKERVEVNDALAALQEYVCASSLDRESERQHRFFNGVWYTFGGLTIATLNGSAIAATVGIAGPYAAASMAVGAVMANEGVKEVREWR